MNHTVTLAAAAASITLGACVSRSSEDMGAHMDEHFAAAVDVQTAVIRGRVDEASEQAVWLARHPVPEGVPSTALRYVESVRDAARAIVRADDLQAASRATGLLALACGDCHEGTGGGPGFLPGPAPTGGPGVRERMMGHIWAADRMWEGLVARSDESWRAGSDVLAETLLSPRLVTEDTVAVARMNVVLDQVAGVSTFARREREWERRAELYGQLLPTCSGCHEIFGVDPFGLPGDEPVP